MCTVIVEVEDHFCFKSKSALHIMALPFQELFGKEMKLYKVIYCLLDVADMVIGFARKSFKIKFNLRLNLRISVLTGDSKL